MTAATFALASFLAAANVVRVTFSRLCAGRCGTLYADRATLLTLFGGRGGYGDGEKVTEEWYFETPDGPVGVWDYWYNAPGEWSIAGSPEACAAFVALFDGVEGVRAAMNGRERARVNLAALGFNV